MEPGATHSGRGARDVARGGGRRCAIDVGSIEHVDPPRSRLSEHRSNATSRTAIRRRCSPSWSRFIERRRASCIDSVCRCCRSSPGAAITSPEGCRSTPTPRRRLASIAPETPSWFSTLADRRPAWMVDEMSSTQAKAYMGVGLIAEFLAHRILKRAHRRAQIPVVLNGTVVGTGRMGRECVSIDVSYAGDPLDARHLRVAYSSYQKHIVRAATGRGGCARAGYGRGPATPGVAAGADLRAARGSEPRRAIGQAASGRSCRW